MDRSSDALRRETQAFQVVMVIDPGAVTLIIGLVRCFVRIPINRSACRSRSFQHIEKPGQSGKWIGKRVGEVHKTTCGRLAGQGASKLKTANPSTSRDAIMLHRHAMNARESRNDSVSLIGTPRADRKIIPGSETQPAGSKEIKLRCPAERGTSLLGVVQASLQEHAEKP